MTVFLAIAGVSLILLIATALIGDLLDGIFDSLDFTGGYLSSTSVLAFLATFGLTGAILLAATDLSPLLASLAGAGAGALVGAGAGYAAKSLSEGPTAHQISIGDYIGKPATVSTPIPASGLGEIRLTVAGRPQALAARCDMPLPAGTAVTVTSNIGPGMVRVMPAD